MNGRTLALVALFSITAGTVMSDPAQPEQKQPASQSVDVTEQSEFTPSQLIAQDFRTIAQDHATVGAANSRKNNKETAEPR